MSDCPSITQLKQLIDDMLPPCEFEDVETHLETCVDCAATLDALTANGAFSWLTATTDLSPSSADAPRPARPFSCALPGYEVLEELGRGGHGVVYRARQLGLNRPVAIKVLRKGSFATPQELSRFLAEAESVARLSHPQIVQVFAVGEYEGLPFFAMELLEGGSLAERCQGVPVASRSAARLIERLARGVDHAHRHNVIHRDLKPGNILFDRAPGGAEQPHESPRFSDDDLPKIADFGLAKQLDGDPAPTPTVAILGTPSYMAPEQALGGTKAAGPAADIYALGAVLYELLTGRPPFRGETPFETLMQVRDHEPVGPRQLQPRLAVDLETICLKCLRKRPLERYASAAELADDLGRFLRGEAVRARPPGPIERLVKWSRRNPVKSSLSGFGLVALFAALAATAWVVEKVHETRLRTQAEALVGSLESTESPRLPDLIKQLEPLRVYASPRLRQLAKDSGDDSSLRLRVGLALLPDDPKQVDYLYGRLDSVSIDELLVMRTALANYRDQLVPRLSNELQLATSTAAQRVRRGCLLAAYDPDNPQWKNIVGDIARFFVAENPLVLGQWTKAFEPVQELLIVPLAAIFRDENRPETERVLAATVLAEYGGNRASLLANLVQEAEPRQFSVLLPVLREQQDAALPVLWAQLSSPLELNSSDAMQDASARRQARSAVALLQLGMTDILPALFERHDPRLSSYLMHYLSGYGVPASIVIADLKRTREPSARHFLILSLGEYSEAVMPLVDRAGLTQDLLADYHNDSDPGIHGALDWLLRQRWGLDEELTSIERERAGQPAEGRGWLVDKQGSTFVIFRNPGRFTAGSPETEPGHDATEGLLEFQLEHDFALSNREVTVEEFQKFLEANPQVQYLPPPVKPLDPREPARNVTWFQAAQYCRWRSEQEGLVAPDSEDSCYPPLAQIKLSMGLKPGFLKRPGYRLPLDLEWEFACRAGTRTSRFYGHDRKLLDHYAWSLQNSQDRPASVGMLKPNRFGLFDMYGNVWEWTHDYRHFSAGAGRSHYDDSYGDTFPSENRARGGSYLFHAPFIRSAKHYSLEAERGDYTVGFRLARTLPAPQLDQP